MEVHLADDATSRARALTLGVNQTERWVVVAFRGGRWAQMYPRHCDKFPVCGSRQEAQERALIVRATDSEFAARWRGWMFTQVPLDSVVEY